MNLNVNIFCLFKFKNICKTSIYAIAFLFLLFSFYFVFMFQAMPPPFFNQQPQIPGTDLPPIPGSLPNAFIPPPPPPGTQV